MQNKHWIFSVFLDQITGRGWGSAGWSKRPTFSVFFFWWLPLLVFSSDNICGDHPIIWAIWCNLHNFARCIISDRLTGVTRATGVKLFRQFILIRWNMWQMARDLLTIFVYKSWYKRLEFFKSIVCVVYELYGRVIYGRVLYYMVGYYIVGFVL